MTAAAAAPTHRGGWPRWLLLALLALAALRIGTLVLHHPVIGVANNYDMIRVQACIEAYPDRAADIPPGSNSYLAPLPRYRFIADVGAPCFLTSEVLFAWAAWPAALAWAQASSDGTFPLQLVGTVKGLALWGVAALFSLLWWRDGRRTWALGNAAVAAFVLADPGITIYLNTFYAESAAVFFAYAALAAVALACTRGRAGAGLVCAIALLLALAVLGKIQHVVFGVFVFGAVMAVQLVARLRRVPGVPSRVVLAVALGALLGTGVQLWHMQSPQTQSIADANATNTFLFATLGLSAHPARAAAALGLPAACADHAGKSWFSPGVQERHPCPEVLQVSRMRLLALAWRDPDTLLRMLAATLDRMRGWVPPILGKVEGLDYAPLPRRFPSADSVLAAMPMPLFATWLLLPGLLAPMLLATSRASAGLRVLLLALGTFPWLSLVVVTFGDGLADAAKQSHLGITSAVAFWLLAACVVSTKILQNQSNVKSISTLA